MHNLAESREHGTDWERIYQRLAVAREALHRKFDPGPDEQRQILRSRAKLLAREPEDGKARPESLELVEFLLADEHYAVEWSYIREICALKDLRPLPGVPAFVLGLIHVRGQILTVIDIKRFFDMPAKGLSNLNKVLIVRAGEMEVGILADAVVAMRSVAVADLQPNLPTLTGIRAEYIRGVTKELMIVLAVEKMLSDERMIVDEG